MIMNCTLNSTGKADIGFSGETNVKFRLRKYAGINYEIKACLTSNVSLVEVTMLTAKNYFEEHAIRIGKYSRKRINYRRILSVLM